MRLETSQSNIINLEIEPGETLKVNFCTRNGDPSTLIRSLSIGTMLLPGGGVALNLHFGEDNLYVIKTAEGQTPILSIMQAWCANKLEFVINESGTTLQLSRADLRRLLDEEQLEYPRLRDFVR